MSRKDLADESALQFSRVFDFSGRVVLITGAASGIGKAIAELFSERGAQLALIDKSPNVESVARALGDGARSWEADIVEDAQVARVVGEIATELGRIDVLINNARRWRRLAGRGHFKRGLDSSLGDQSHRPIFRCPRGCETHARRRRGKHRHDGLASGARWAGWPRSLCRVESGPARNASGDREG
jgi:NAD(P)-dependent dehydrogenase (short-subunit alcohol dehydrogenase family)